MELYPVEVAEQLLSTPAVQAAVKKFEQEWQGAFGQAGLAWPGLAWPGLRLIDTTTLAKTPHRHDCLGACHACAYYFTPYCSNHFSMRCQPSAAASGS